MKKAPSLREIDTLVSRKIFGRVPCAAFIHKDGSAPYECHAEPEDPKHGYEVPLYSSDMGQAMMVVARLLEEKWWMFDLRSSAPGKGMVWFCDSLDTSPRDMSARFESLGELPKAICLAALKKFGDDA